MRAMKKHLSGLGALSAVGLAFALVLGFALLDPGQVLARGQGQERPTQQSEHMQARAATFAGTVVRDGEQYELRDSSGETFRLDDAARAKPFIGKTVKVIGELDAQAKVIHVESIVNAEG